MSVKIFAWRAPNWIWPIVYLYVIVCCFNVLSFFFFRWPRAVETKKKAVQRAEEQLMKLEVQATDREENKQIALGTSKLNYLDPRISVAWWETILNWKNVAFMLLGLVLIFLFISLQVQKVWRSNREDLQQNSAWEICLGYWHGWKRLWILNPICDFNSPFTPPSFF